MALKSGRVGIHPSQVDPITGMLLNGPTPGSISFEDLSDAQITDPEVGQTLIYNGEGWENEFSSISPTTLSALQDVQITDVEDGDYLVYDATNNKWINSASAPTPVTPEGSTVLPTDDIQTWLACAAITDKTYTTLNEVLADSTTLLALMSDNNAVDYLVRSTTWASGVTANSTAMTDIGANNYCANTLLDDATWCDAICNSTYFESVLNAKVPTMTGYTTPSGVASAASEYSALYAAWRGFSISDGTGQYAPSGSSNQYLAYEFDSDVTIYCFKFYNHPGNPTTITSTNVEFQCYSDNEWKTQKTFNASSSGVRQILDTFYTARKHRVYGTMNPNGVGLGLQMYGRQDI